MTAQLILLVENWPGLKDYLTSHLKMAKAKLVIFFQDLNEATQDKITTELMGDEEFLAEAAEKSVSMGLDKQDVLREIVDSYINEHNSAQAYEI